VFIARESGRQLRIDELPDQLAVSVVTIGELRAGVLSAADSATRVRRLGTFTAALGLAPLPIDEAVAESWAHLRVLLRDAALTMGVNDSWIAATALAHRLPVVTQDAHYVELPELQVVRV
jgi:predicted nucleic acid-binding protein